MKKQTLEKETPPKLTEGIDFYFEGGLMVLTEKYLLDRGFCCDNGCRHCPYGTRTPSSAVNEQTTSPSDSQ